MIGNWLFLRSHIREEDGAMRTRNPLSRFASKNSGNARRDQDVEVGFNLSERALGTGNDLGGPKTF